MAEYVNEDAFLNVIYNFQIPEIPINTRFWMIRTKKGYFYQEFFEKQFVALAWNSITKSTDFDNPESLNDSILMDYPEIKRPSLVVNKCKNFINEISPNDILVIPSAGSKFITFAYAGEYFEEESKTVELEQTIINRIEHGEVVISEVACPYRKRRRITIIRTIPSDIVNHHLYKAITSYHGISNLDEYGTYILDHLFNYYTYKNNTRFVFHVGKTDPITSKEFSGFLYNANVFLTAIGIDDSAISTQASVQSIGDIIYNIKDLGQFLSDNYLWFIAIFVVLGGGKFLTVELPGLPNIIKNILSISDERKLSKEKLTEKKLDNAIRAVELQEKMKEINMSNEDLLRCLNSLNDYGRSMDIRPLDSIDQPTISDAATHVSTDNEEEQS